MPLRNWICAVMALATMALLPAAPAHAQSAQRSAAAIVCESAAKCEALDPVDATAGDAISAANRALLARCDGGDARACSTLADAFVLGRDVGPSPAIAAALYDQACAGGVSEDCAARDVLRANALDDSVRFALEEAELQAECDAGKQPVCLLLAQQVAFQRPDDAQHPRAVRIAAKSCDAGFGPACITLVDILTQEGSPAFDPARAVAVLVRECAAGKEGCARLKQGDPGAAEAFRLGCARDNAAACLGAARAQSGLGSKGHAASLALLEKACAIDTNTCFERDYLRDRPTLEAACGGGDTASCARLGSYYADTRSVFADPAASLGWLARACDGGDAKSCAEWALATMEGKPAPGSEAALRSHRYLERTCAAAYEDTCIDLARALIDGTLGPQDDLRAAELLRAQCGSNEGDLACSELRRLAGRVPGVEVAVADERIVPPDFDPGTRIGKRDLSCQLVRSMFRGQTFEDVVCDPVVRGIKGFRARPGAAPWQALLERPARFGKRNRVACGGSLIAPGWILTAAHCTYDQGSNLITDGYKVRLGVYRPNGEEGVTYGIKKVIRNPGYIPGRKDKAWDAALLQIDTASPERLGAVEPIGRIRLDPAKRGERTIADAMPVYAYGWGWAKFVDGDSTEVLQGVKMQLVGEERCAKILKFVGSKKYSALCAGGPNGEQTCFGDSGGPLVYYGDADNRPTLIGIVSAGFACGTRGLPSQYTRVSEIREWIERTIAGG